MMRALAGIVMGQQIGVAGMLHQVRFACLEV